MRRAHMNIGFVGERPDPPDYLTRPIAVIDNTFRRASRSGEVRSSAIEPAQTSFGVGDDGGERLVHFMRDGGGQLAQGCYAHAIRPVRLRVPQPPPTLPALPYLHTHTHAS